MIICLSELRSKSKNTITCTVPNYRPIYKPSIGIIFALISLISFGSGGEYYLLLAIISLTFSVLGVIDLVRQYNSLISETLHSNEWGGLL